MTEDALGEIYFGAGPNEVQALFDKLADRGLIILHAEDLEDRIADDYADDNEDVIDVELHEEIGWKL
jgi:hypothetical protein